MIPQEEITYKIKLYDAITYIAPMAEIDYILKKKSFMGTQENSISWTSCKLAGAF